MEPTTSLSADEIVLQGYVEFLIDSCQPNLGNVTVAEYDGMVVGYAAYWEEPIRFSRVTKQLYLSDLFVDPAYRGRGIGKALLVQVEKAAADRGLSQIGLTVLARNAAARALYEKIGYRDYESHMVKILST